MAENSKNLTAFTDHLTGQYGEKGTRSRELYEKEFEAFKLGVKPARAPYLDTSIFGGYFDTEFKSYTKLFFNSIEENGDLILVSTLTIDELSDAPAFVKEFFNSLKQKNMYLIEESMAAIELADEYIREKVVGKTSQADSLHIASASVGNADLLISWNFKHIVNVPRITGYNHVDAKFGYQLLRICSPKDFIDHEKGTR